MPTITPWKSRIAILWLGSAAPAAGLNTRPRLTTGITLPRKVNTPSRNAGDKGSAVIFSGKLTTSRMQTAGRANSSVPSTKEPNSSQAGRAALALALAVGAGAAAAGAMAVSGMGGVPGGLNDVVDHIT